MKYKIIISLIFFSLIGYKNVLNAEEDNSLIDYHTFDNGWNIYIDPTLNFRCLIQRITNNGSDFRLGTMELDEEVVVFLAMFNKKWQSINSSDEFEISMKFDTDLPYYASGIGVNELEPGFFVNATNEELMSDFMLANTFDISVDNNLIEKISLKGSYDATLKLAECQDWVLDTMESLLSDESTDPFRQNNNSLKNKKNRDPFQ